MRKVAATLAVAVLVALSTRVLAQSTITLQGSGSYLNLTGNAELRLSGSAGSADQLLTSGGSGATPVWKTLAPGTGITVTSGPAALTVAAQNTNAIWNANQLQGTPIASPLSPALNNVLAWNGTAWTAASLSSLGGVTGTGTAGQVAFWTGTSTIAGDNNLFWDNTTKRLGIGTSSPAALLHVAGAGRFDGALTVTTGGAAITGNVTVTGNLSATGSATVSNGLTVSGGGASVTGNLSLSGGAFVVGGSAGTANQILVSAGAGTPPVWKDLAAGTGITVTASGTALTVAAQNTNAIWNANQLQGTPIASPLTPNSGDILQWNGTAWVAVSPCAATASCGYLTSVATSAPITGNGTSGNPVRLQNGSAAGDILVWNGGAWGIVGVSGDASLSGTGALTLATIPGLVAATYGSSTQIPVITVDAKGRITAVSTAAVTGDNWGTQVAQTTAPITGNGTGGNPIGLNIDGTTLDVSGGQLTAKNTSAIWDANKLQGTPIASPLTPSAGQVLQWDGSKWVAAGIGAAGGWAVGGNALSSDGSLGTTSNHDVIFIRGGTEAMRLTEGGRLDFRGVGGGLGYRIDLPNNSANSVGRIRAQSYANYSSLRWKEEVRPIENALDKVMRLRGIAFRWKPEYGGTPDIGFAMEEVDEVIPEIVHKDPRTGELSGMDYSRVTAVLVEGLKQHVREQEQVNARLQQENAELRARLERLESLVGQLLQERGNRGSNGGGIGAEIHDAWLGQNIPNPFEGTTTIPYYVPAGVGRAELVVRDLGGRELRRVELPERGAHGQVTVEMRLLGSGTYEYALVLDGRVVAVKQMTLLR